MENKYFTPDIEDLCIGYECEYNFARAYTDEFDFVKIGYKDVTPGKGGYTDELTHMIHLIDDGAAAIRVPYLTKEQIENEGWKENILNNNEKALLLFSKNGYELRIYKDYICRFSNLIVGAGIMPNWDKVLFEGKCKDINTFRKICKLLEI